MLEDNDAIEALESFGRTLDDIDMSVLRKLSKRKCTTDEIQFYGQFLEPLGAFSGSMGVAIGKVVSLSLCELPQRLTKKAYEEEREEISKAIMSATQSALSNYNGSDYQNAKKRCYVLGYVPTNLLTEEHRREVSQLQEMAKTSMSDRAIGSQIREVRKILNTQSQSIAYHEFMKQFCNNTKEYREKYDNSITRQTLLAASSNQEQLSGDTLIIKTFLDQNDIILDDNFYQLLDTDEEKKKAVSAAIEYLAIENQEALLKAKKEQFYDTLNKGFVLLDRFADVSGTSELKKIAALGINGATIGFAISKLTAGVSGAACVDPIFAIAMAAFNLYEIFFNKPGPSQLDLMQRQLNYISGQINELHKEMRKQFDQINERLVRIEALIKFSIQSLQSFIRLGVVGRLAKIEADVHHLINVTKDGFRDLLVNELDTLELKVASYYGGVVPSKLANKFLLVNDLCLLSAWLKQKSFSKHLTGLLLFNCDEVDGAYQRVTDRQFCDNLKTISNSNAFDILFPVAFATAKNEGWISAATHLPNITLWRRALSAYLQLRTFSISQYGMQYDPDEVELGEIIDIYHGVLSNLNLVCSSQLLQKVIQSLIQQFNNIEEQYSDLAEIGLERKKHQITKIAGKTPNKAKLVIPDTTKVGKEIRGHINLHADPDIIETILSHINQKSLAENSSVNLFDPNFLLAEREGLIQYKIKIFRSTTTAHDSNKKRVKHCYKAEDDSYSGDARIRYGVDIIVTIVETGETFKLTSSTSGYATWRQNETEVDSFKNEMSKRTIINTDSAVTVLAIIKRQLDEHYARKEAPEHYTRIIDKLINDRSSFYTALKYLYILKFYYRVSGYNALVPNFQGLDAYIDSMITQFNELNAYMENVDAQAAGKVESFFQNIKRYKDEISKIEQFEFGTTARNQGSFLDVMAVNSALATYQNKIYIKPDDASRQDQSISSTIGGFFKKHTTTNNITFLSSLMSMTMCMMLLYSNNQPDKNSCDAKHQDHLWNITVLLLGLVMAAICGYSLGRSQNDQHRLH